MSEADESRGPRFDSEECALDRMFLLARNAEIFENKLVWRISSLDWLLWVEAEVEE